MIDIHSHILPEIDDGASSWEASLEMCQIAVDDGISTMAATPHMLDAIYDVSREVILEKIVELRNLLEENNINLSVVPGADVHAIPEITSLLEEGALLSINDTGKYLLVEFPHELIPNYASNVLFSLQTAGITPIITHPERNLEVQRKPYMVKEWAIAGNLIQVTAASITGDFGKKPQECSMALLEGGLIHVVATDAHSPTWRSPILSRARALITELTSEDIAKDMFVTRPHHIINGISIDVPEPIDSASIGTKPKTALFRILEKFWKY